MLSDCASSVDSVDTLLCWRVPLLQYLIVEVRVVLGSNVRQKEDQLSLSGFNVEFGTLDLALEQSEDWVTVLGFARTLYS